MMMKMVAALAEFERATIRERASACLAAAIETSPWSRSRRRAAVLNVRFRCHVLKRNNFARTRRPSIFFDAVAPMHRIRPALSPRFQPPL
jgi:DNA invertase Pin-like site-specific DNA recombinase